MFCARFISGSSDCTQDFHFRYFVLATKVLRFLFPVPVVPLARAPRTTVFWVFRASEIVLPKKKKSLISTCGQV